MHNVAVDGDRESRNETKAARRPTAEDPVAPFIERDGCPNYIDSVEEGLCNVLKEQRQGSIVKESGNSRTR